MDDFSRVRAAWLLRDYAKSGACGPLRAKECEELADALHSLVPPGYIRPEGQPLDEVAPALCDTLMARMALPVGFVYGPVLDKRRPPEGWLELKGQIETAYDYPKLRAIAVVEWPEPKVQERFGFATFRLPYCPNHWIKAKP